MAPILRILDGETSCAGAAAPGRFAALDTLIVKAWKRANMSPSEVAKLLDMKATALIERNGQDAAA